MTEYATVLFPSNWPTDLPAEYGVKELKQACSTFLVPYCGKLKQEYRDYKDCNGIDFAGAKPNLKKIICAMHILPNSTAECERGLSRMNIICTRLRTALTIEHISSFQK